MTWNLLITTPARKELKKIPQKDRGRINAALITIQNNPFRGDLKRLKGTTTAWRCRVGNYRIIYDLYFNNRMIVVGSILRRTSTTYE